jgi:hypothetical protein
VERPVLQREVLQRQGVRCAAVAFRVSSAVMRATVGVTPRLRRKRRTNAVHYSCQSARAADLVRAGFDDELDAAREGTATPPPRSKRVDGAATGVNGGRRGDGACGVERLRLRLRPLSLASRCRRRPRLVFLAAPVVHSNDTKQSG